VTRKLSVEADGGSPGNRRPAGYGAVDAARPGSRDGGDGPEASRSAVVISAETAAADPHRGAAAGAWGPPQGRPTTTLLLRHGETALSTERRFAGRGDIPLTGTGRRQAAAAARRLSARGGIDVIVTSPQQRARRTAETVAAATGAALKVEDDLVEADFGEWEGLTFAEAAAQWPDEMAAWLAGTDAAPPGGESFATVAHRVLGALDRLLAEHQRRTVVLVSHVTPIKTLACRAILAPPAALFRIHLDVASVCEIDWFADGPAVLRSLNDTAHLRRGRR
jgi:broad specificity phosphatase PhoE